MKTIIFPLEYKEGTKLIQYPEEPTLFKDCKVIENEVACNYYGGLDTYDPYVWLIDPSKTIISKYNFLLLVGVPSMVAIKTASKTDVVIEVFVMMIETADEINLSEQTLLDGFTYLVSEGVITQDEVDRILQGV